MHPRLVHPTTQYLPVLPSRPSQGQPSASPQYPHGLIQPHHKMLPGKGILEVFEVMILFRHVHPQTASVTLDLVDLDDMVPVGRALHVGQCLLLVGIV